MKLKYDVTVQMKMEGVQKFSEENEFVQKTSVGFELDDEKALAFL